MKDIEFEHIGTLRQREFENIIVYHIYTRQDGTVYYEFNPDGSKEHYWDSLKDLHEWLDNQTYWLFVEEDLFEGNV